MWKWWSPDTGNVWSFYKDGLYVVSAFDAAEIEIVLTKLGLKREEVSDET